MPEYLAPGVYVTEISNAAKPIEGVSTTPNATLAAIVAEARRLLGLSAPAWTDDNESDPGVTLIELFAWLAESLLYRANSIPERAVPSASRLAAAALVMVANRDQPPDSALKGVRYFTGRFLEGRDLTDEQEYYRDSLERHNRELHGAGIVNGLEVSVSDKGRGGKATVTVSPGYALDRYGREIVVVKPVHLCLPAGFPRAYVVALRSPPPPPFIVRDSTEETEFRIVSTLTEDVFPLAQLTWKKGRKVARPVKPSSKAIKTSARK